VLVTKLVVLENGQLAVTRLRTIIFYSNLFLLKFKRRYSHLLSYCEIIVARSIPAHCEV